MKYLLCLVLAGCLEGCTLNIVDKRLTREEVAEAFKQRDEVLKGLATSIKDLKKAK